jgi:hypothetical protein
VYCPPRYFVNPYLEPDVFMTPGNINVDYLPGMYVHPTGSDGPSMTGPESMHPLLVSGYRLSVRALPMVPCGRQRGLGGPSAGVGGR